MSARALLVALALAGCAHERVVIQPVEVKVPVMIPCAAELPPDPERLAGPVADIFQAMQRALAELEGWEAWAKVTKATVQGCQPKGGKP